MPKMNLGVVSGKHMNRLIPTLPVSKRCSEINLEKVFIASNFVTVIHNLISPQIEGNRGPSSSKAREI